MAATRQEALRLYRDIIRAARNFPWPHESGRPWRVVLIESARAEFDQSRDLSDTGEAMRRLIVGRHCLEETAAKFEQTRQDILAQQKGAGNGGAKRPDPPPGNASS